MCCHLKMRSSTFTHGQTIVCIRSGHNHPTESMIMTRTSRQRFSWGVKRHLSHSMRISYSSKIGTSIRAILWWTRRSLAWFNSWAWVHPCVILYEWLDTHGYRCLTLAARTLHFHDGSRLVNISRELVLLCWVDGWVVCWDINRTIVNGLPTGSWPARKWRRQFSKSDLQSDIIRNRPEAGEDITTRCYLREVHRKEIPSSLLGMLTM